ncbi:MAG: SPFH domain-containing protein [bacterium]|nr:SPFH domain-containing protein [bacterium]
MTGEIECKGRSGGLILLFGLLLLGMNVWLVSVAEKNPSTPLIVFIIFLWLLMLFVCSGLYTVQPNQAAVLTLMGKYVGTVKTNGLLWTFPFNKRTKVSLRANTLNGEKIKVNDKSGNPIEIAAIVVWQVKNTAQAVFDVENYYTYVTIQSESATRHLASSYSYDAHEQGEISLRGSIDEVSKALQKELEERVQKAGVVILETRLSHLAYAPEIAQVMLRRQQAEAIIAARQKIVHGAVSMVEMALQELAEKKIIELDDERKAAMVSNLMVVLCGEGEVQPIINTGTLYT